MYGSTHPWNAFEWYNKYPDLVQAAGRIPFPYRPGMSVPLGSLTDSSGVTTLKHQIQGVMAIDFGPSVGKSSTQTDPISIVVKELYARVRRSFSGSIDADPPDFVIYMVALDSLFAYTAWLKRVYRCVTAYTPDNYQMPNTLLLAMGFSSAQIEYLRLNKMRFWQNINELIYMTRKFKAPAVMDYLNRHHWMNEHVYTDTPSLNSQLYLFNQVYYYRFALLPTPDGVQAGGLNYVPLWSNLTGSDTVTELYEFGRSMVDALAGSDDAYMISGYLDRAYEGVPSFAVAPLLIDEVIQPVFDEEVLSQIQNSRPVGLTVSDREYENVFNAISQDPKANIIVSNPSLEVAKDHFIVGNAPWNLMPVINIRDFNPDVPAIVEATRLTCGFGKPADLTSDTVSVPIQGASEITLGHYIISVGIDGTTQSGQIALPWLAVSGAGSFNNLAMLSQYDWHPQLVVRYAGTGTPYVFGDTMNITSLTGDQLENLNRIALYSELNAFNI